MSRIGVSKQDDITYTVIIAPDRWDERMRWNMTAVASWRGDTVIHCHQPSAITR